MSARSYLPVYLQSYHTYSPLLLFPSLMSMQHKGGESLKSQAIVTVFSGLLAWSPTQYWDMYMTTCQNYWLIQQAQFSSILQSWHQEHLGRMRYHRHWSTAWALKAAWALLDAALAAASFLPIQSTHTLQLKASAGECVISLCWSDKTK